MNEIGTNVEFQPYVNKIIIFDYRIKTMKQLFFWAALLSLSCPFTCCKTKKAGNESTQSVTTTSQENKMRVVISFISKGAGIDAEKRQAIQTYIENHPKKPANSIARWGREGESDFNLKLSELTKTEQSEFINEIKKLAAGSPLIFITENTEQKHLPK